MLLEAERLAPEAVRYQVIVKEMLRELLRREHGQVRLSYARWLSESASFARTPPSPPFGGVERPRRKERFARLMHRPGRVLSGPAVCGGNLSLPWLPLPVVPSERPTSHNRRGIQGSLR
jgi:hypothetical protein